MLGLIASGVLWVLVGLLYQVGNPATWWDIVWYAVGTLTIGWAVRLLGALIQRARTHGLRSALRWLVS
jgi:membrane protease YdiL (CAAX protease family)